MVGWVGTFWDLKHVGVTPDLDAILAQDREGLSFFPLGHALPSAHHPLGLGTGSAPVAAWALGEQPLRPVRGG